MNDRIEIVEVSPRDGIQDEKKILDTEVKVALIRRAIDCGVRRIEATSFVNPRRVPQMADAAEVMAELKKGAQNKDVQYIGLALNQRGFERAVEAGVDQVNFVVVASETFNQRNQGAPVEETMRQMGEVAAQAVSAKVRFGVTIGASFGCPFEGEVALEKVVDLAKQSTQLGAFEIGLADTIGVAVPTDVAARVGAIRAELPDMSVRCHFHNTRNTGLANAAAALSAGVTTLDSSIGGVGGCPFAPNATGNIPTEDLVYMLDRMGVKSELDLSKLIDTAAWLERELEIRIPAMLGKAGPFPSEDAA